MISGKRILLFFLCWMVPTLVFYYLPVPQEISPYLIILISFCCIGIYLVLASSLSYQLMNDVIKMTGRSLKLYICLSCLLFALIYLYVRLSGSSSIVIASFSTANLLFISTVIGAALSSAVKRVAELIPICITAAVADWISVIKGPTKEMVESLTTYYEAGMEGIPPMVDFIVIKVGIPGYSIPMPLFGMTDWIFIILLSSALVRLQRVDNLFWRWGNRKIYLYFPVAAAALFTGVIWAQTINSYIPAMVFISTIFLLFLFVKLRIYKEVKKTDIRYSIIFPAGVSLILLIAGR